MTKEDIVICLANALERNQSMENAIESLINAGFTREEVEDAAREVSRVSETARIMSTLQPPSQSTEAPSPTSGSLKQLPTLPSAQQKKGVGKLFIIIGVIILIALILASWGAYVYLKGRNFF